MKLQNRYVQAINSGGVPVIGDAWTAALEAQAKSAREAAAKNHAMELDNLRAVLPLDAEELTLRLRSLQLAAVELYVRSLLVMLSLLCR